AGITHINETVCRRGRGRHGRGRGRAPDELAGDGIQCEEIVGVAAPYIDDPVDYDSAPGRVAIGQAHLPTHGQARNVGCVDFGFESVIRRAGGVVTVLGPVRLATRSAVLG